MNQEWFRKKSFFLQAVVSRQFLLASVRSDSQNKQQQIRLTVQKSVSIKAGSAGYCFPTQRLHLTLCGWQLTLSRMQLTLSVVCRVVWIVFTICAGQIHNAFCLSIVFLYGWGVRPIYIHRCDCILMPEIYLTSLAWGRVFDHVYEFLFKFSNWLKIVELLDEKHSPEWIQKSLLILKWNQSQSV